jgi:hypothetical protein
MPPLPPSSSQAQPPTHPRRRNRHLLPRAGDNGALAFASNGRKASEAAGAGTGVVAAFLNGTFAINQRAYASGTALAAGAYAHDRWKAGSAGCTYTFTQAVPDTSATITAGSLVQAVDASNVYATAL